MTNNYYKFECYIVGGMSRCMIKDGIKGGGSGGEHDAYSMDRVALDTIKRKWFELLLPVNYSGSFERFYSWFLFFTITTRSWIQKSHKLHYLYPILSPIVIFEDEDESVWFECASCFVEDKLMKFVSEEFVSWCYSFEFEDVLDGVGFISIQKKMFVNVYIHALWSKMKEKL